MEVGGGGGLEKNLTIPGAFCQKHFFFDILEVCSMSNASQISSNLLKKHLQHDSFPFFPLALCFTPSLFRQVKFLDEKGTNIFRLFCLSFFPSLTSFCSSARLSTGLASNLKKFLIFLGFIETDNFYHGVAKCCCRKF